MDKPIFYISNQIDPNLHEKIVNLNMSIITKRVNIIDELIIKKLDEYDGDKELFLIKKYFDGNFLHKNFINYYAIINFTTSDIVIVMPKYPTLDDYLSNNIISSSILLQNLISIIEMNIYTRDKFNFVHYDVKIENILFKNNTFYLIDWEKVIMMNEMYHNDDRPTYGNTEMYPHYNATPEQFFIYSIGVLILRIIGYDYDVTYIDFVENHQINYILNKIPQSEIELYESIINDIFNRKYNKIEELKDSIQKLK
jgi:hypothetical protein